MPDCRCFRIVGQVQGVWFRECTRRQAHKLAITGYARNCPDGSVEVFACGSTEAVSELLVWLHHGPELAKVEGVEELPAGGDCRDGFYTA